MIFKNNDIIILNEYVYLDIKSKSVRDFYINKGYNCEKKDTIKVLISD